MNLSRNTFVVTAVMTVVEANDRNAAIAAHIVIYFSFLHSSWPEHFFFGLEHRILPCIRDQIELLYWRQSKKNRKNEK